jgi:NMD protein affecting ribosome stability and mRNA decay
VTAAALACTLCGDPIDGLPFGPMRHPVCQSCWWETGTYERVTLQAKRPEVGDYVRYPVCQYPNGEIGWERGAVVEVREESCAAAVEGLDGREHWFSWDDLL